MLKFFVILTLLAAGCALNEVPPKEQSQTRVDPNEQTDCTDDPFDPCNYPTSGGDGGGGINTGGGGATPPPQCGALCYTSQDCIAANCQPTWVHWICSRSPGDSYGHCSS
jgi:hypothetical protein